jgi:hypothetical protein
MFEAAVIAAQAPPTSPGYFRYGDPDGANFLKLEVPEPSPSLRHYTHFARMAFLRATLRPEKAVETCEMLMALSDSLATDPFPASQFTRARVFNFAIWPVIQQMLRAGRIEEARRLIAGRLLSIDVRDWILLAMRGERAIGIEFFEGFVSGKRDILNIFENTPDLSTRLGCLTSYPGIPWIKRDYAAYLALEREKLDSLGSGYSEWLTRGRKRVIEVRIQKCPLLNVIAGTSAFETLCEMDANARIARLALGLDEDGAPDPYLGQPLHVRQEGQMRMIWSVGRNGKDDGGSLDDIVWRVP